MKTELTLNVLQTMSAQEYEDIRAAGSDERRELTHACVHHAHRRMPLNVPITWLMPPDEQPHRPAGDGAAAREIP
ncbi:hypothetical protein GUB94_22465 [Escherichia coli]|nr:hypothetical protein [Escherichia coli]